MAITEFYRLLLIIRRNNEFYRLSRVEIMDFIGYQGKK